jgi:hypothetical protein
VWERRPARQLTGRIVSGFCRRKRGRRRRPVGQGRAHVNLSKLRAQRSASRPYLSRAGALICGPCHASTRPQPSAGRPSASRGGRASDDDRHDVTGGGTVPPLAASRRARAQMPHQTPFGRPFTSAAMAASTRARSPCRLHDQGAECPVRLGLCERDAASRHCLVDEPGMSDWSSSRAAARSAPCVRGRTRPTTRPRLRDQATPRRALRFHPPVDGISRDGSAGNPGVCQQRSNGHSLQPSASPDGCSTVTAGRIRHRRPA